MKLIRTMTAICAFCAVSAYAVDPQPSTITCEQLINNYEATDEARERFADLEGSCEGVYEVNGALYARAKAIVRGKLGNKLRLYLPATDHTFEVMADPGGRVYVGNTKVRARDLTRGDEIGIYLSVDKFARERVQEIAYAAPDESDEEIVVVVIEEIVALPTTASTLPLLALLSALLLAGGVLLRTVRVRR